MLGFTNISIDITNGIDTKTDEKLVLATELLTLENGIFQKGGSIKKRNGYKLLTNNLIGGGQISSSEALSVYAPTAIEEELIRFDNGKLYAYSEAKNAWIPKGFLPQTILSTRQITNNTADQTLSDSVIYNNIGLYVWKDSRDGVRASIVDEKTGAFIQSDILLNATATKPRCIKIFNTLLVIYADGGSLKCTRLDLAFPNAFQPEQLLANDLNSTDQILDACDFNDSAALFCYGTNANFIKVAYLLEDGTVGTLVTGFPNPVVVLDNAKKCISIGTNTAKTLIFIYYVNPTNTLKFVGLNTDFTIATAPLAIFTSGAINLTHVTQIFSGATVKVFVSLTRALSIYNTSLYSELNPDGTVVTLNTFLGMGCLASKPFIYKNDIYVWNIFDTNFQATYYLFRLTGVFNEPIVAKAFYGVAGRTQSMLARVNLNNNTYVFTGLSQNRVISENGIISTIRGVSNCIIDFENKNKYLYSLLGEVLHFVGGIQTFYDGISVVENGFNVFPEMSYALPVTVAPGGVIGAGTYLYTAIYKWTDNRGNVQRSAPSPPISVNVAMPNQKVAFSVPSNILTRKSDSAFIPRSNIEIEIYRTENNGQIFYKVYNNAVTGSIFYSTIGELSHVFTDNTPDTNLIGNELLYTVGGELDNDSPPPSKYNTTHKNRLFTINDRDEVNFSKEYVKGDGVNFSQTFVKRIDPFGGPLTAVASLDTNLIGFKQTSYFYLSGEGPTATGEQDDYANFQLVNTTVGCSEPASIVRITEGLVYKSLKGIRLLDRSLADSYIGAKIEGYNSANIVSGDLLKDADQIRFKTSNDATLVYDYYFRQWSTFTNSQGLDAVIYKNAYTYLRNNNQIYVELPGYFKDDTKTYQLKFSTAWIKLTGIQNFQRVTHFLVIGDYKSPHKLAVSVAYDYQQQYLNTYTFDPAAVLDFSKYGDTSPYGAGIYGTVIDNVYQFRTHLAKQKCEAIKFKFEDIVVNNSSESYSISNLTLRIGQKQGAGKFLKPDKML